MPSLLSLIYILSAATSLTCSLLLLRGYRRGGGRLLLWSAICFAGLTIDNIVLLVDVYVVPQFSLDIVRKVAGLVGLVLLIYGLVWETNRNPR
jgi:hypothetical protein